MPSGWAGSGASICVLVGIVGRPTDSDTRGRQTMSDNLETLVALRHRKFSEILTFMAKSYELGGFDTLDSAKQEQLRNEVEGLVDEHNEAIGAAEPIEMASLD